MKISLIAAIGLHRELGKDGDLIWRIKEDLQNFKKITLNHCIVMGRKTFDSIGRPLPKRTNIVMSRGNTQIPGVVMASDVDQVIKLANENDETELMIIGGATLYELFLPHATHLYLSRIQKSSSADVYFPEFDQNSWVVEEEVSYTDSNPAWVFQKLSRK